MKKLLVLLLIFMLSLAMISCGSSEEELPDADEGVQNQEPQDEDEDDEEPEKLDPDELIMSDSEDELMAEYDFDFEAAEDFKMVNTIEKVDYSDISALAASMEQMLSEGIEETFGGGYDVFSDYEEDANDSIDKLAYAVAMENSDSEASYLETGVYHDDVYDKHFQYTVYTSDNAYEFSSDGIKASLAEMKDAYGITISQKTAEKAVKEVLDRVTETQDYFSLYQEMEVSGSGYDESIIVSIDGFCNEDGSLGYYFAVERERCYE